MRFLITLSISKMKTLSTKCPHLKDRTSPRKTSDCKPCNIVEGSSPKLSVHRRYTSYNLEGRVYRNHNSHGLRLFWPYVCTAIFDRALLWCPGLSSAVFWSWLIVLPDRNSPYSGCIALEMELLCLSLVNSAIWSMPWTDVYVGFISAWCP